MRNATAVVLVALLAGTARAGLYNTDEPPAVERVTLTAVPYYSWGNREPGEMEVWVRYCAS